VSPVPLVALLVLGCTASAQTDARILYAIGQVEGGERLQVGDSGEALGLYQMHPAAWADGNAQLAKEGKPSYPRSSWRSPLSQDLVAFAYLRALRGRLTARGIPSPSPECLALCWNLGFSGAEAIGFRLSAAPPARASYARRVGNLVRQ
jgi:hypothetical protein